MAIGSGSLGAMREKGDSLKQVARSVVIGVFWMACIVSSPGWSKPIRYSDTELKYFNVIYSWLYYSTATAVHHIGRPTYSVLSRIEKNEESILVGGAIGGLGGALTTIAINEGHSRAKKLIGNVFGDPRYLSDQLAESVMEKSFSAYRENYEIWKTGLANISDKEREMFDKNNPWIMMYDEARKLKIDVGSEETERAEMAKKEVISALEKEVLSRKWSIYGAVWELREYVDTFLSKNIPLEVFDPYKEYIKSIKGIEKRYSVLFVSDGADVALIDISAVPGEPGFDCDKAAARVEKIICASGYLSGLDRKLTDMYGAVQNSITRERTSELRKVQRRWLRYRDKRCSSVECLEDLYRSRIQDLFLVANSQHKVVNDSGKDNGKYDGIERRLVFSENFETESVDHVWKKWNGDDRPAQHIEFTKGYFRVKRYRALGNGGKAGAVRRVDIPVSGDTFFSADVNPVKRDVRSGCGDTCGEYPINMSIYVEDVNSNLYCIRVAVNYGRAVRDKDVVDYTGSLRKEWGIEFKDGYYFTQKAISVDRGRFNSISFRIGDIVAEPSHVSYIAVFGNGWNFEGRLDNIKFWNERCVTPACSQTDTADPQEVAEGFWNAVIARDYKTAEKFIIPRNREKFISTAVESLERMPSFPDKPIIKAVTDGDRGKAILKGWGPNGGSGPDMIFRDGKWWIEG